MNKTKIDGNQFEEYFKLIKKSSINIDDLRYNRLEVYDGKISLSSTGFKVFDSLWFTDCEFKNCHFDGVSLFHMNFGHSDFLNCTFTNETNLIKSDLTDCYFEGCAFIDTKLLDVDMRTSTFKSCKFSNSVFKNVSLVDSTFTGGKISGCEIYGVNLWNANIDGTNQSDLSISQNVARYEDTTSVDDIELSSLINYLSKNKKFSSLNTDSNFVLLLGSFESKRYENLKRLKQKLKEEKKYVPILCDWNVNKADNLLELVVLLAGFSRFIVVDLSSPRSVPAELQTILSSMVIPVIPLIEENEDFYTAYKYISRYQWVENLYKYQSFEEVLESPDKIIYKRAERLREELSQLNRGEIKVITIKDV